MYSRRVKNLIWTRQFWIRCSASMLIAWSLRRMLAISPQLPNNIESLVDLAAKLFWMQVATQKERFYGFT